MNRNYANSIKDIALQKRINISLLVNQLNFLYHLFFSGVLINFQLAVNSKIDNTD